MLGPASLSRRPTLAQVVTPGLPLGLFEHCGGGLVGFRDEHQVILVRSVALSI